MRRGKKEEQQCRGGRNMDMDMDMDNGQGQGRQRQRPPLRTDERALTRRLST